MSKNLRSLWNNWERSNILNDRCIFWYIDFKSHSDKEKYLMRNSLAPKYLLVFALLVIGLSMIACLGTAPTTPTEDAEATALMLQATEQALSLLGTEQAIKATQDILDSTAGETVEQVQSNDQPEWVEFEIINNSNVSICRVFFSPASEEDWLEKHSHSVNILPNTTQTFNVRPGVYDLRVDDCSDDDTAEQYDVDIPTYTSWKLTPHDSTENDVEPLCGNGVCGDFENPGNCPQDCK